MAYCIPNFSGVPGSTDPFDWWKDPVDPAKLRFSPDNPNWVGAFSLSEGAGANSDMRFRAIKGQVLEGGGEFPVSKDYLFLSWIVRVSALDINGLDHLNVVLGDGANYVAFQIKLATAASKVAGTQDPPDAAYSYRVHNCTVDLAGAIAQVNPPAIDAAAIEATGRMWVDVVSPGRGLHTLWAFQVAIPLGEAWAPTTLTLPASGAFKLWYELWSSLPNATVPYRVPTTPANIHTTNVLQVVPPGLTTAHMLDVSTGGVCDQAVTIAYNKVGARNVNAGDPPRPSQYDIRLDLGKPYPPNNSPYDPNHTPNVSNSQFQNRFFAIPSFPAGLSQAQREAVRARFSLANWGSQYTVPTANSWKPVPGGDNVQYLDANTEATFVWPLPGSGGTADAFTTTLARNINKYLNAVKLGAPIPSDAQNPHQCMLVELSSTNPSVVFTRSSIYVNMDITRASIARAPARISIEGLPPIGSGPRDVYLYLQTFNMPKVVTGEGPKGPRRTFEGLSTLAAVGASHDTTEPAKEYEVEDIAAFYPTYIVHAYHDTGEKMTLENGRTVPILHPQTAFGYFVLHEGELHGWETRLYGAEKLADNFYRMRVRNDGASYVETAIQARESASEPPLPPDGIPSNSCVAFAAWLASSLGPIGKLLAWLVRPICDFFGNLWWIVIVVVLVLIYLFI